MADGRSNKSKFWEIAPRGEDESSREYRCWELINKLVYLFLLLVMSAVAFLVQSVVSGQ